MPLVIPPGHAQVSYAWSLEGDNENMICTVGAQVASFEGDFQAAADAYADAFSAGFGAAGMTTEYVFRGVVMRVGQDGGPPVIVEAPRTIVGTLTPDPPPQNCAVLVKKSTTLGGRRGRGRMFLPPFAVGETGISANGVLAEGTRSFLQAGVDQWFEDFIPGGLVLLHDSEPTPVPTPTNITSLTVDVTIATQRRRLRR